MSSTSELYQIAQTQGLANQNPLGAGLNTLAGGFLQGQKDYKTEQDAKLDRLIKIQQLAELQRKYEVQKKAQEEAERLGAFSQLTENKQDNTTAGKIGKFFDNFAGTNGKTSAGSRGLEMPTLKPTSIKVSGGDVTTEYEATDPNKDYLNSLDVKQKEANLLKTKKEISDVKMNEVQKANLAEDVTESRETAKQKVKAKKDYIDAKSAIGTNDTIIKTLLEKNKNTYNGKIAGWEYKAKQMTGLGTKDEKFQNTAYVVQELKAMVAKVLKSTFGGQLSDSEREYLNTVYGAAADYTQEERRIAIDGVKRMFDNKLFEKKTAYDEWTGGDKKQPAEIQPGVQSQSPKPGGVMHQDAAGNKAWVYPDGTFDEVK
jgi:hypothetical protein